MDISLTENAMTVLQTRYLKDGETPEDLFWRVAKAVAAPEGEEADSIAVQFYYLMASGEFLPNSPTLFNAGTGEGTLSACFVIPVEDTMESIMKAASTSAMIQKFGGGIGYSFSRLRAKGQPISTTHGKACGAVAVLKMFSSLSDMITQGGKRHGANMGILDVSHPEIFDFIHLKDDDATAQNFNISVAVTDAFMEAVINDNDWALVDPDSGIVQRSVKAKDLWEEILESAWKTGDPGLYFIDEANRYNPTPLLGNLDSTNPCGEVPLLGFEACNLGSINLGRFVSGDTFDWLRLEAAVKMAVRFLDNVVTVNQFPIQEVREAVDKTRKIGLGVMGWHDALVMMGVPYHYPSARIKGAEVMGFINDTAREASKELAKSRGAYPASTTGDIRNATRTCIAPTGTISVIAGASSGIEPIFAVAYVKNVLDGKQLREVNPLFVQMAKDRGFYSEKLIGKVVATGSVQGLSEVPDVVKSLFKTALEIDLDKHIEMQAAFQKHTDLAVSKTINLPNSATVDDVRDAYLYASQMGCIGITVYRDGSKDTQVLEVEQPTGHNPFFLAKRERPARLLGETERVLTGHGNLYVTINSDEAGMPFEILSTLGKAGNCETASIEAISRLASLALRSGVKPMDIVKQLSGITCVPAWDKGTMVRSPADGMALALQHRTHIKVEELTPVAQCPECYFPTQFQEGCEICHSCGWSKC